MKKMLVVVPVVWVPSEFTLLSNPNKTISTIRQSLSTIWIYTTLKRDQNIQTPVYGLSTIWIYTTLKL